MYFHIRFIMLGYTFYLFHEEITLPMAFTLFLIFTFLIFVYDIAEEEKCELDNSALLDSAA